MNKVEALKHKYKLQKHPEGGFYTRTFTSKATVKTGDTEERNCSSAIYYLLEGHDVSNFHKIDAEEMWHYYDGDSDLIVHMIDPETGEHSNFVLGRHHEDSVFQATVPPNVWFAAELVNKSDNSFVFVGCTVTPAFVFSTFQLADKNQLLRDFPDHDNVIRRLSQ